MDLKTICKVLANDSENTAEQEIDLLQRSIASLMLNLGAIVPAQSTLMTALVDDMNTQMKQLRARRKYPEDLKTYFTGKGKIARKLKEHMAVADWFETITNPPLVFSNGGRVEKMVPSKFIERHLELFNFQPTDDVQMVTALRNFCYNARPKILTGLFATPKPALPPAGLLAITPDIKTGLYGDGAHPETLTMILRARCSESGIEVIFYVPAEQTMTIWYHHPYENVWVSSFDYTFEGVVQLLEKELEIAFQEAGPIERDFDFVTELERLEKQAHEIFDNESVLPQQLFCYSDGLTAQPDGEVQPFSMYVREKDTSTITIVAEKVHLVFRNTRGAYPLRSRQLCRAFSHLTTKVEASDMSRHVQESMVQKSSFALSNIGEIIKYHKRNEVSV